METRPKLATLMAGMTQPPSRFTLPLTSGGGSTVPSRVVLFGDAVVMSIVLYAGLVFEPYANTVQRSVSKHKGFCVREVRRRMWFRSRWNPDRAWRTAVFCAKPMMGLAQDGTKVATLSGVSESGAGQCSP